MFFIGDKVFVISNTLDIFNDDPMVVGTYLITQGEVGDVSEDFVKIEDDYYPISIVFKTYESARNYCTILHEGHIRRMWEEFEKNLQTTDNKFLK